MKVCQFCGVDNPNTATICSSCGGNEFNHKCDNCGTVFEEGNFCPICGVKAGAKAKKCPNCGAKYYTNACPDCGYIHRPWSPKVAYVNTQPQPQPAKKSKTWLWVLGWIFIFPVPLTILVAKTHKINEGLKVVIIIAAWLLYAMLAISNGSSDEGDSKANTGKDVSQPFVTEKISQAMPSNHWEKILCDVASETVFTVDL